MITYGSVCMLCPKVDSTPDPEPITLDINISAELGTIRIDNPQVGCRLPAACCLQGGAGKRNIAEAQRTLSKEL